MAQSLKGLSPHFPLIAACLWTVAGPLHVHAQQPARAAAPANFDPSDVYFQGWLLSKDAEELRKQGKNTEALEKLRRAQQLFDTIARTFPQWKTEMVDGRRKKTHDSIAGVAPEALAEQETKNQKIAELEGGTRVGAGPNGDGPRRLDTGLPAAPVQPMRSLDTLESRRIKELEQQVGKLQDQIKKDSGNKSSQRELDLTISELQRSRTELDRLRRQSASSPMQAELEALSRRINGLEQEKAVMGRALDSSRSETAQAKAQIDALQNERGRLLGKVVGLEQEMANVQRNLELERNAANEVVRGQLKQIKELQGTLKKKDKQLAQANDRIQGLETQLTEMRDSFDELREERNELLRERDQMAALLKLNEAGQLQEVIDQNMALDRELRETKKRYEMLQEDSDSTKDDLLEALRDLAISKLRIQEFRRENTEQSHRLDQLQQRLEQEALALNGAEIDPAEAAMLRGIITKQLRIQEKRTQARQLLMDTLRDKAALDEGIRDAMVMFQGAELNLSPEELRVIDGKQVGNTIISPFARPRSEVERSLAGLNDELKPYHKAGARAFQNDRLHAARDLFGMIVERNPGDVGSMCKLGLVEYKLRNPVAAADMFQQAAELDPRNPYAYRMLGQTLSKELQHHVDGISALERAVELAPTHAEGHLLLGNAQFRNGNYQAAEEAFKTSISCNPTLAEPHHNLALLFQHRGMTKKALEHYSKSLELGAAPNLDLEKQLSAKR